MNDLWLLMGAAAVATYACRALGVLLSGRIATDGDFFGWVTCVTYAMVAGLVTRIIVMPTGSLASTQIDHRLIACVLALAAYYVCRRNLFAGVGAGAMVLTVLTHF